MTSQKAFTRIKSSTKMPYTTISHSLEMETRRVLYFAAKLPGGTLQSRGFFILPELSKAGGDKIIVFPNLPYHQVRDFWKHTSRLTLTTPLNAPQPLLDNTANIVRHDYNPKHLDHVQKSLISKWNSIENRFWHNLFTLFPHYTDRIDQLNIYLTQYGAISSFNLITKNVHTMHIYARTDITLDKLIWGYYGKSFPVPHATRAQILVE